ncbi:MAG: hypothetical protein ACLFV7_05540 [Phycisphaerae bacterium]
MIFIERHLSGRVDTDCPVTHLQIRRVELAYLLEVNDMPEIPAYQNVDLRHSGKGNVHSIFCVPGSDNMPAQVVFGEPFRVPRRTNHFGIAVQDIKEFLLNLPGSLGDLGLHQV